MTPPIMVAMGDVKVGDLVWWGGGCTWRVTESRPGGCASEWILYMESERWPVGAGILLRKNKSTPIELVAPEHVWKPREVKL